jgi:hypothetical protein
MEVEQGNDDLIKHQHIIISTLNSHFLSFSTLDTFATFVSGFGL